MAKKLLATTKTAKPDSTEPARAKHKSDDIKKPRCGMLNSKLILTPGKHVEMILPRCLVDVGP